MSFVETIGGRAGGWAFERGCLEWAAGIWSGTYLRGFDDSPRSMRDCDKEDATPRPAKERTSAIV